MRLPRGTSVLLLSGSLALTHCGPADGDGDGYSASEDCDDDNSAIHPGAEEICGNGIDEDCTPTPACRLTGSQNIASIGRLLSSELEGALAGLGLAPLGDLDSDGFADFVVGLPGDSTAAEEAGGLVLWFGSATGPSRPIVLHGSVEGARAGSALVAPGDLDGDGLPDLAVGAPGEGPIDEVGDDASLLPAGAVYLLGGPFEESGNLSPRSILRGSAAGDCAGTSLAAPGDLDGDGLSELLVGAPCRGSYRELHEHIQAVMLFDGPGTAYLVSNPPPEESSLDASVATFSGEATWDRFGLAMTALSDLDGDGRSELAIGAPDYFGAQWVNPEAKGKVFVFSGDSLGVLTAADALATIEGGCCGADRHDEAGRSLAATRDGLLVGAPSLYDFGIEGGAFLLTGPQQGTVDAFEEGSVLAGPPQDSQSARTGWAVTGGFDFDCDGEEDLALGSPRANDEGARSGAVLLSYGPTADFVSLGESGLRIAGDRSGDETGTTLISAGDVDGDGCDDLLVGAPGRSAEAIDGGGVWFIAGRGD